MDSKAWGGGQPSNGGFYYKNENCLDLYANMGYQWNDERCFMKSSKGKAIKPICQKKM